MKSVVKITKIGYMCDQSEPVMIKGVILRTVVKPAIKWRLPTDHKEVRYSSG